MAMVPYVCETYQHRAEDLSACRTVNFYQESLPQPEGKTSDALLSTPGIKLFCDVGTGISDITRGLYYTTTGVTYAAIGDGIWRINPNGTSVLIFAISSGSSRVSMVDNGWRMNVVDGSAMWSVKLSDESVTAVSVDTTSPKKIVYLGKRMIVNDGTQNFWWSDVGDDGPLTWPALNVDQADSFADPITSMAVVQGQLWLFGPRSFEPRRLTTDATFPFAIIGGAAADIGCGAPDSVATLGDSLLWLGSSAAGENIVYMNSGSNAARVSNYAIEYALGLCAPTSDASGWAYQSGGHTFYVLTLERGDRTFVLDLGNGKWHERASRDDTTNELHKWRPKLACYTASGILLGSSYGPFVLKLDDDTYTEFATREDPLVPALASDTATFTTMPIQRIHQSPHYWKEMGVVSIDEFTLDISTGGGLQNGQGEDPQVMMQLSKDGGHTFGSEHWRSFGRIGDYAKRVAWRMLGRTRSLVIRITVTDPVRVTISGGRLITSYLGSAR